MQKHDASFAKIKINNIKKPTDEIALSRKSAKPSESLK
jgi:hypothetical protein